jgi:hypothetical protein
MPPLPSAEWVSWPAQHRTSIPHPPGWFHRRPRGTHVQPLRARAYGRQTPIDGVRATALQFLVVVPYAWVTARQTCGPASPEPSSLSRNELGHNTNLYLCSRGVFTGRPHPPWTRPLPLYKRSPLALDQSEFRSPCYLMSRDIVATSSTPHAIVIQPHLRFCLAFGRRFEGFAVLRGSCWMFR